VHHIHENVEVLSQFHSIQDCSPEYLANPYVEYKVLLDFWDLELLGIVTSVALESFRFSFSSGEAQSPPIIVD
jgi:hypothetical protein